MASAAPSRLVNFFCWKIDRRASWVGAQVPRVFCRQKSLSVALIETTRLRLSGFSGLATQKLLPSPSWSGEPTAAESDTSSAASALVGATAAFSERTDILERGGPKSFLRHSCCGLVGSTMYQPSQPYVEPGSCYLQVL